MSDNSSFSVVVTEGIHDVASIGKILQLKGFQEAKSIEVIPDCLKNIIPKQYPFEGTELSRRVPYPSFFYCGDYWILVSNAGGDAKLINNLKGILRTPRRKDIISKLCGAAVLADADVRTAADRRSELQKQLVDELWGVDDIEFDLSVPSHIMLYEVTKPFEMYIFPDNHGIGTLERILLQGAQAEYSDLLQAANRYIECAKGLPCGRALKNFDGEKAVVGAIVSVLKPGKAPQASFHDNNWFTISSLANLPLHQSLSSFIDVIIGWAK